MQKLGTGVAVRTLCLSAATSIALIREVMLCMFIPREIQALRSARAGRRVSS